jgi:hypothetical protein
MLSDLRNKRIIEHTRGSRKRDEKKIVEKSKKKVKKVKEKDFGPSWCYSPV